MPELLPDTPAARPDAPAPAFAPPKGFETKFRDLELHLAAFDGPLDLLLYLIREQKLDILDLPMADVTRQYMDYLLLMEELNLEFDNRGCIQRDLNNMTRAAGIFAAGDMAKGATLVVRAIADGRNAADGIVHYLAAKRPSSSPSSL